MIYLRIKLADSFQTHSHSIDKFHVIELVSFAVIFPEREYNIQSILTSGIFQTPHHMRSDQNVKSIVSFTLFQLKDHAQRYFTHSFSQGNSDTSWELFCDCPRSFVFSHMSLYTPKTVSDKIPAATTTSMRVNAIRWERDFILCLDDILLILL